MLDAKIQNLNQKSTDQADVPLAFDKRTYTVEEVQNILNISRASAYSLVKKGYFKTVRIGCTIRISKKVLMNGWIASFEIYIGDFEYETAQKENQYVRNRNGKIVGAWENRVLLFGEEELLQGHHSWC